LGIVSHRLSVTIIEVRPSKKFKDAWVAFEAPGIEPAFAAPDAKQKAIDYSADAWEEAMGKCTNMATTLQLSSAPIVIDGRGQYPQAGVD